MSLRLALPTLGLVLSSLVCGGLSCTRPSTTKLVDPRPIPLVADSGGSQVVPIRPLAGFKVYENNKEKFAMQYPEAWSLREDSFNTLVSFLSPHVDKDDKFAENVNVVNENLGDKNVTLDQYYKVSEENLKKFFSDFKLLKNEATTLSGVPARMVIYTASQDTSARAAGDNQPSVKDTANKLYLRTTQIFTIKDGKAFIITITNTQADPNQYMTEMLKIAQSFQFLP